MGCEEERGESQREAEAFQGSPGSFGGFLVGFGVGSPSAPAWMGHLGPPRTKEFLSDSRGIPGFWQLAQVSHFNPGIPGGGVEELSSFLLGMQGDGHSLLPKKSIRGKTIPNFPSLTPGNGRFCS